MMAVQLLPLRGALKFNEPMASHTSWRIGGPAERYYEPADIDDLANFLAQQPVEESIVWVGLGSNLLVRDGGIKGTVIMTSGLLNGLSLSDGVVRVEAGVSCAKVARFCARHHLVGAEFLAGIPGTMGGALAMNAGAFGGETWNQVVSVETINYQGQRFVRQPAEFDVSYRHVKGVAHEWFVAAHLKLELGDAESASLRIRELLDKRNASQPIGQPSCGSVFRNPDGDYAARLIELSGLKGQCIGGACISEKHANFIVNTGGANAADMEALIDLIVDTVRRQHGVELCREVHIVGEAASL